MAHLQAVMLLAFVLFCSSLVNAIFIDNPVDPILIKIEQPNLQEDEVYFAKAGEFPAFLILQFQKDNSIVDDAAWNTRVQDLFNNVVLVKESDAVYNEITEANTDLTYPTGINDNIRITNLIRIGTSTRYKATLTIPATNLDDRVPVRVSYPTSVFPFIQKAALTNRHFSPDFVSGLVRSPSVLFDTDTRQKSGVAGNNAPIWRRNLVATNTRLFGQDSARFIEPPIQPEIHHFLSLDGSDGNSITVTNGAPGPNGEGRYFKVAFQTNILLEPGQSIGCFWGSSGALNIPGPVACDQFFDFWTWNGVNQQARVTTIENYDTNGRRLANINEKYVANGKTQANNLFGKIILTTGTTVLPGDTIFAEFQVLDNIEFSGYFGLHSDANNNVPPLPAQPFLARVDLNDPTNPNGGQPVLLRMKEIPISDPPTLVHRTTSKLNFLPLNQLAGNVDRYMPRTSVVSVSTHFLLIYYGIRINDAAGFQVSIIKDQPLQSISFSVGSPDQTPGNALPSLSDDQIRILKPTITLSGVTDQDFVVTTQENGDVARQYQGTITISGLSNQLVPFISGSKFTLFFDPPIEVRNGKVAISWNNKQTATDTAGVLTNSTGNKIVGVTAATIARTAVYEMNVDCLSSYGLLGCGSECRHYSDPNHCGGCSVRCTDSQKCMFSASLTDSATFRARTDAYSCRDPTIELPVPVPLNPASNPTRPTFGQKTLNCPPEGSGSNWCFYWIDISDIYANLGAVPPSRNIDTRYHVHFRFKPSTTTIPNPNFEVRLYNDFDALALVNSLPLIPNNPLLSGSVVQVANLANTTVGSTSNAEWYSVGTRPNSNAVLVAMKFADRASAAAVSERLITDDLVRVQAKIVRGSLLPSAPAGGFSAIKLPIWSNADFTEPLIVGYDYSLPFDALTNRGLQFNPSPGGVVIRWQAAPDTQTPLYDVYLEITPVTDAFNPASIDDVITAARSRTKRDWEWVEEVDACCQNGFSGVYRFQQNRVARIDVAGLSPNTEYRAWMVFADVNNRPNYSPIVTRIFTTSVLIGQNDARSTININLAKTVTVSV